MSPDFQASVLTITLQHLGTRYIKFTGSNHLRKKVKFMLSVLSQYESATYLFYSHYSPDQQIRSTRGYKMCSLSTW